MSHTPSTPKEAPVCAICRKAESEHISGICPSVLGSKFTPPKEAVASEAKPSELDCIIETMPTDWFVEPGRRASHMLANIRDGLSPTPANGAPKGALSCKECEGSGLNRLENPINPHCPVCGGKGWIAAPAVVTRDEFHRGLADMLAKCPEEPSPTVAAETVTTVKRYVAGFMFNAELSRVAMIRKNKPEWQKGLLNGIGGKVEAFDVDSGAAMVREFLEEAGCSTRHDSWSHFASMGADGWGVDFFACRGELSHVHTVENEPIEIIDCATILQQRTIENIPWLVWLAIDHLQDGRPAFTKVEYPS